MPCTDTCCRPRDDYPDVVVLARRYPTARKAHSCRDCPGAIEKGQRYARTVALVDGDLYSEARHIACDWEEPL
jgi:hypothetical protein